ncbi:MAG: DUF2079 domain-containing protein, partial [Oscillochloris sp.]|nr:DUF2079 domain-containing protein [Oscillochloris sp.]
MSKSSWRLPEWVSALFCFVLAGIACTWPLITRFSTDLPGDFHKDGLEDAYQNVWNLWWIVQALSQLRNPLITDRFFFPESPKLFYHTLSPINILLAAPVTALWGPIAGFNTVVMLSFALGGLGMWALARERVGHGPALLAGLAFVASPFHMASIVSDGQLQIFALQWLPWYILFLLRALRTGNRRTIFLAGFFLTLTAWTDWYYTLFLLIFTAGAAVWELRSQRSGARAELGQGYRETVRRITVALLGIGAISAVGAAPLVVPMLIEAMRHTYMNIYPADDPARLSVDLLAFLVPPRGHAIWGRAPWSWGVAQNVNRRFYLGLIISALALLAMLRRSAARPWGLMALTFGLLALGAELRVNRVDTG